MNIFVFSEIALRWAWGTLLTAIVTALLTMLLKHGHRWFRGARKFIRTGRLASGPSTHGRGRHSMPAFTQGGVKEPRFSAVRFLTALAQLTGNRSSAPQQNNILQNNDVPPLDLRF